MVVLGEYTKTRGRFLLTALVLEGYFFCSLGPAWVAERRSESQLSQAALAAAVVALALLLIGIWGTPNSDAFWKSAAIVTILAVALAYLAVVDVEPGRLEGRFACSRNSLHRHSRRDKLAAVLVGFHTGVRGLGWRSFGPASKVSWQGYQKTVSGTLSAHQFFDHAAFRHGVLSSGLAHSQRPGGTGDRYRFF